MQVTVVYSPVPRQTREWTLDLPAMATVGQALELCGFFREFPALQAALPEIGIWGKKAGAHHTLQEKDRIEIYRRLLVDPKVARRERFRGQGVKSAGLFARKRAGAKAGY